MFATALTFHMIYGGNEEISTALSPSHYLSNTQMLIFESTYIHLETAHVSINFMVQDLHKTL